MYNRRLIKTCIIQKQSVLKVMAVLRQKCENAQNQNSLLVKRQNDNSTPVLDVNKTLMLILLYNDL